MEGVISEQNMVFKLTGDTSLTIEFGNEISEAINARVRAFDLALERSHIEGIVETVPAYRSLTVHYSPRVIRHSKLAARLREVCANMDPVEGEAASVIEIPVLYGGEEGPDLCRVAEYTGKTPDEVISIHSTPEYLIYMLGFTPGFPYLGGMDRMIVTPRLKKPRVLIPAGSVGIAGGQTGVYPIDSPGGWQLIGRTPIKLFDRNRENAILLSAGQYIKFVSIDRENYNVISALVERGGYECRAYSRERI